jgi:hypothetical protein
VTSEKQIVRVTLLDRKLPKPVESTNPQSNPKWDCEFEMEQLNSKKNVKHTSKVLKFFIFITPLDFY